MEIPKIITRGNREYIFVQKCNNKVYLYKEKVTGYKETFTLYDLGLIQPVVVRPRLRKNMNMKP